MEAYRIFVSYSHEDLELVKKVVQALKANGLKPIWSKDFCVGWHWKEAIQDFIAHSHVFMPILTETASKGSWVHQEIGYAVALNIPVFPVTQGDRLAKEMLEPYQGLVLSDNPKDYRKQLPKSLFEERVKEAQENSKALYECAERHEDRTRMIVDYAAKVRRIGYHGRVRQKATLSSFNIPDLPLIDAEWEIRHGSYSIGGYLCDLLWKERRLMEEHAREAGCSLIIYPHINLVEFGNAAKIVRLKTLMKFLESMPPPKVRVAINAEGLPRGYNQIIVGDWFMAEAVRTFEGKGYRQTIFTRHAPTVRSKMETFDFELRHLLQKQEIDPDSSRDVALEAINKIVNDLEK